MKKGLKLKKFYIENDDKKYKIEKVINELEELIKKIKNEDLNEIIKKEEELNNIENKIKIKEEEINNKEKEINNEKERIKIKENKRKEKEEEINNKEKEIKNIKIKLNEINEK